MAARVSQGVRRYVDEPLDVATKEVRLLRIRPGRGTSPIICSITRHRMVNAPPYAALSYTWSQPDPNCRVQADSGYVSVTWNLLRFFQHMRGMPGHRALYFWFNAICTNQYDLAERGQQVSLMATINTQADRVILGLGPTFDGSDLAMKALMRASSVTRGRRP